MYARALLAAGGLFLATVAHASTYDYVLGHDEAGDPILGGSHAVVDLARHREAMDHANRPTAVHPDLVGDYLTFDASRTAGETDWDVFASSWWPMSENGIARRWAGDNPDLADHSDPDDLSPIGKYDWLVHPGQEQVVPSVSHWNYDELDLDLADRPDEHTHPAVEVVGPATAWELENHGVYQSGAHPEGWWGHCNGWASYAVAESLGAPERDVRVKLVDGDIVECAAGEAGCVLFRMGDIEALMGEVYFDDSATFAGDRCNIRPDDIETDAYGRPLDPECRDLNPATFHIAVVGLLDRGAEHLATGKSGRPAMVIDHNYDYEVWNFPLVEYEITATESLTEAEAAALVGGDSDYLWNDGASKWVRVALTYWMVSDSVSPSSMLLQADQRSIPLHDVDLHYVLELDASDEILGGEWIDDPATSWGSDSRELHPDFMWIPTDAQGYYEASDDTGGDSDNPHLSYPRVHELLACANDPSTCAEAGDGPVDPDPGSEPGTGGPTTIDCSEGCAGRRTSGPVPYVGGLLPLLVLVRRRREG